MTSPSMPDFNHLTEQLAQVTKGMQQAHTEFEATEVHGGSPDGAVRATMRSGRLVGLTIEPRALEPRDAARLADQVLAAVRDCEDRTAALLGARTDAMNGMVRRMMDGLG
ncbi:YbaB/EbfC family nucleoid-associated protein [Actinoplanes sp. NPDC000266]